MTEAQGVHRKCIDPSCSKIREERDALLLALRDLSHAQLVSRDLELGLRAELTQARIDMDHVRATAAHALNEVRRSRTWRLGSLLLSPARVAKRFLSSGTRIGK